MDAAAVHRVRCEVPRTFGKRSPIVEFASATPEAYFRVWCVASQRTALDDLDFDQRGGRGSGLCRSIRRSFIAAFSEFDVSEFNHDNVGIADGNGDARNLPSHEHCVLLVNFDFVEFVSKLLVAANNGLFELHWNNDGANLDCNGIRTHRLDGLQLGRLGYLPRNE